MRKSVLFLLALLLLLTACHPVTEPPSDSSQPTQQETTSDSTLQETLESTGDLEDLPDPELSAEDCLLAERETLSYEEFFGKDRVYVLNAGHVRREWAVPSGEEMILFKVKWDKAKSKYYVYSDACEGRYYIPGIDAYRFWIQHSIC